MGGANGVDSESLVGVFEGGSLGKSDDPVLSSNVSGCADCPGDAVNRRGVYYGPRALLEHYGNLAPHAVPDAVQVYFDYVKPVLYGNLVGQGPAQTSSTACVVVSAVEAAVEVDSLGDKGVDLLDAGDVAGYEGGFASRFSNQADCFRAAGLVDVGDDDLGAFPGEDYGGGSAEAVTRAPVTRATLPLIVCVILCPSPSLCQSAQLVEYNRALWESLNSFRKSGWAMFMRAWARS